MSPPSTTLARNRSSSTSSWMGWTTALLLLVLSRVWEANHRRNDDDDDDDDPASLRQRLVQSLQGWLRRQVQRMISPDNVATVAADRNAPRQSRAKNHCVDEKNDTDNGNAGTMERRSSNAAPPPRVYPNDNDTDTQQQPTLVHVRRQQAHIHAILHYWFGQYSPQEAQKKLWMISSQAADYRRQVDLDIVQRFGGLLVNDTTTNEPPVWKEWCDDNDTTQQIYGIHGKVAAIILLDQLARHVHRFLQEQHSDNNDKKYNNDATMNHLLNVPPQSTLDAAALDIATNIVDAEADLRLLSTPMQVFCFMPFRHARQLDTVQRVQAQMQAWTALHEEHGALLARFRKATQRRLAVLQDEARRKGTSQSNDNNSNDANDNTQTKMIFTHEDILETLPFKVTDMTPATKHVVYTTIQQFLVKRGISHATATATTIHENYRFPVVVSLSGGVDSMVICAVLAHLAQKTLPLRVVAVHIDYANRPESAAEAAFCRDWCAQHQVEFYMRRIDEVTRGVTARDEYETISRQVRYAFYRQTVQQYSGDNNGVDYEICVVLGHHRGDLRENVLSNAHKGSGPLDLSGMTATSRNDGVLLYRPLLPLEKTFIFDYAHTFGVPYFKDTTPHWSTRGKLRNRLLPLLEEIYGEGCLTNLSNLAVESDECRALLQKVSFGPFMDAIQRKPMGMVLSTAPWKEQGLFFWKFVLREALHSGGFGMFSDKAVVSFLERARPAKQGWLQCRKDYAVYLQANGQVFVWKPDRFPWHKKDQYKVEGRGVEYGLDQAVQVGPWRVTALLVPDFSSDADGGNDNNVQTETENRLQSKALNSMMHLMDGSLTYYVQVPTWQQEDGSLVPRRLVFRKYTKPSRPLSWKSTDTRVQDTLPLLGNDDESLEALTDPIGAGAVYVDESGATVSTPTQLVKVSVCLSDVYPATSPATPLRR